MDKIKIMKKIIIFMLLSISSLGFAQTSINIKATDYKYNHRINNDKWSEWSPVLKISYKINIDLENKKIVFINQDNDEKTNYIIKGEDFSKENKIMFMVLDSKQTSYIILIVSSKDSDEKKLHLISENVNKTYTITLL